MGKRVFFQNLTNAFFKYLKSILRAIVCKNQTDPDSDNHRFGKFSQIVFISMKKSTWQNFLKNIVPRLRNSHLNFELFGLKNTYV